MACDVPPRECLEWHIKPKLKGARPKTDGNGYRALCPAHDDRDPSFGAEIGRNGKVIYGCFNGGCDLLAVRRALIDVYGIGPEHLPIPRAAQDSLVERLERIVTAPTQQDTVVRMQVLMELRGLREPPHGRELEALGAEIGLKRRQAFDCAAAIRASTADQGRYSSCQESVKDSQVKPAIRSPDAVRESAPSAGIRTARVRESAQPDIKPAA